jgi:anaerobic magnesium-protoporphyrin IX monomethyl ester cyclase
MDQPERLDAILVYIEAASSAWTLARRHQLGLYYVAQHATDAGFAVRVDALSSNDDVVERLERVLSDYRCSLLGLYVDHDNAWELGRIVACLKESRPQLQIVLGGPQATGAPEEVLDRIPQAWCAVVGEGEETFVELLRMRLSGTSSLHECLGVAFREGEQIVRTPHRPPIEPLDRLSIPRRRELTLEDDEEYVAGILTGRGCVGRCTFCFEGMRHESGQKKVRLHSVSRCLEEVDYLVREFSPGYITIMDDTFTCAPERLRSFCRGMLERYHGEIKWYCEARVDGLTKHPDLLPLMVEAGLLRMQVGGESGSQRVLDAYQKGITPEQLRAVACAAREAGLLSLYVNFILGGAFETQETYAQTRDLACELLSLAPGCVGIGHSYFTPYPSTPIYMNPEQYGLSIVDREVVTGFGDSHAFCRTQELSRFDVLALGPDFDARVQETMLKLADELPVETVGRIFEAQMRWEIETEWYDVLARDSARFNYHHCLLMGRALRMKQAEALGIDEQVPLRVVDLQSSQETRLVIKTPGQRVLHLDQFDSMLVELSAGKLTLSEVIDVLAGLASDLSEGELRENVLRRYRQLDEDMVIVWKRPHAARPAPIQKAQVGAAAAAGP